MYPLIRRYLRRVDVFYLLLCAACSALSVVVLVSIGQTQLGSNNKASVQLIASLLGLMLAVVFSTADYHALARAWPLHAVVAWGLVLPTLFLHNVNTGLVTIGIIPKGIPAIIDAGTTRAAPPITVGTASAA